MNGWSIVANHGFSRENMQKIPVDCDEKNSPGVREKIPRVKMVIWRKTLTLGLFCHGREVFLIMLCPLGRPLGHVAHRMETHLKG